MDKNILQMMFIIIFSNSINAAEHLEAVSPDTPDIMARSNEIENIAESCQNKPLVNRLTEEFQLIKEKFKKNEGKIRERCLMAGLFLLGIGGGVACIIDGHNKTIIEKVDYDKCLNTKDPICDELLTNLQNAQIEMVLGGGFCFALSGGVALGAVIGYFCNRGMTRHW